MVENPNLKHYNSNINGPSYFSLRRNNMSLLGVWKCLGLFFFFFKFSLERYQALKIPRCLYILSYRDSKYQQLAFNDKFMITPFEILRYPCPKILKIYSHKYFFVSIDINYDL